MLSYFFFKFLIKVDEHKVEDENSKDKNVETEDGGLEEIKYMMDRLSMAAPAEKFYFVLMLGGSAFSQICVGIINFPAFLYERNKKNKETPK